MIEALYVLAGATVAISIDWAIYTHLGAYLYVGFPKTPYRRYREIGRGSVIALARTASVVIAGMSAGFAFASTNASLWLLAVGLFGFRNFHNYRLRVLALCGWNGVINRV
ncbi:hypothetical protein SAMN06295937_10252 [Sphingopyxis flava]|uniref:Uncharacterized protein n=1 Tax=Sphingopyxis flava TaxID=1507287 RepID=A0A1T5EUN7_9SPHN|nr:hypothetical protein SAMN06295937_10252 [Sphingopyxis flava]